MRSKLNDPFIFLTCTCHHYEMESMQKFARTVKPEGGLRYGRINLDEVFYMTLAPTEDRSYFGGCHPRYRQAAEDSASAATGSGTNAGSSFNGGAGDSG